MCDNYRGISVLSPFAKIIERLLAMQITEFFELNDLFSHSQHGFRIEHSCETALQTILDNWKLMFELKKKVLSLFIDFKKAFDLVKPELLVLKLFHYSFDNMYLSLMTNYFSNRSMIVKMNDKMSSKCKIELGEP